MLSRFWIKLQPSTGGDVLVDEDDDDDEEEIWKVGETSFSLIHT